MPQRRPKTVAPTALHRASAPRRCGRTHGVGRRGNGRSGSMLRRGVGARRGGCGRAGDRWSPRSPRRRRPPTRPERRAGDRCQHRPRPAPERRRRAAPPGLARQDDDASIWSFELIEQGRLSYQTKIKFSANAAAAAPSKLDLEEGEEIALIDAIKALITKSANDVAVAVAEHIAGSEEQFARLMTAEGAPARHDRHHIPQCLGPARRRAGDDRAGHGHPGAAGCRTNFPSTIRCSPRAPSPTTARPSATTTPCCSSYEGTDGLKTGYTRASGFNLVASVRRGKKHVIGAVFGGASAASRNAAMRTFLNMGLVKASTEKTRQPAAPLIAQAPRAGEAPRRRRPSPNAWPVPRQRSRRHLRLPQPRRRPSPLAAAAERPRRRSRSPACVRSLWDRGPADPSRATRRPRMQPSPRRGRRSGVAAASPWTASSTLAAPAQPPAAASAPPCRHTIARRFALHARAAGRQARPRRGPGCRAGHRRRAGSGTQAARSRPRPPPAAPQPAASRSRSAPSRAQAEAERQLAAVRERAGGCSREARP